MPAAVSVADASVSPSVMMAAPPDAGLSVVSSATRRSTVTVLGVGPSRVATALLKSARKPDKGVDVCACCAD